MSQHVAVAALGAGRGYCDAHVARLDAVRRFVAEALSTRGDLYVTGPADGAFYVFLQVRTAEHPLSLVQRLIREHRVAVIPGTTFGQPGCTLRLSYGALDADTVHEGVRRLVEGLGVLLDR